MTVSVLDMVVNALVMVAANALVTIVSVLGMVVNALGMVAANALTLRTADPRMATTPAGRASSSSRQGMHHRRRMIQLPLRPLPAPLPKLALLLAPHLPLRLPPPAGASLQQPSLRLPHLRLLLLLHQQKLSQLSLLYPPPLPLP